MSTIKQFIWDKIFKRRTTADFESKAPSPQAHGLVLALTTEVIKMVLVNVPVAGKVVEVAERVRQAKWFQQVEQQLMAQQQSLNIHNQFLEALRLLHEVTPAQIQAYAPAPLGLQQVTEALGYLKSISQASLHKLNSGKLGQAHPVDDFQFYLDLVPERCPNGFEGKILAHRKPRWMLLHAFSSTDYSEIWLAQQDASSEQEAIEFFYHETDIASLRAELDTLKRVKDYLSAHPHIVHLKEINLDKKPYWLACESVEGGNLLSLMQQSHLVWHEALTLFKGVVEGVAAAHALDIIHNGLKPANILLTRQGIPKVANFGLSELMASPRTLAIQQGVQGYASPEQMAGETPDKTDDVYALGVIFWQLATHTLKPLPSYHDRFGILTQIDIPVPAKQLIMDCLSPRDRRLTDAQALRILVNLLPTVLQPPAPTLTKKKQALDERGKKIQELMVLSRKALSFERDWQLLVQIEIALNNPSPRDEEFELVHEYQQRIQGEQALLKGFADELCRREYVFSTHKLSYFKYHSHTTLHCSAVCVVSKQQWVDLQVETVLERDIARLYRNHPERFSLEMVLIFQFPPLLDVKWAQLKVVQAGDFNSTITHLEWYYLPYIEPRTGMEFIWVKGGRFKMGGGSEAHWVKVDGFYMAKYPITQGQWKALMGNNPSYFQKGADYPVEKISWNDVVNEYLPKLNALGNGTYRLPTEGEWEYAARSGGKAETYAGGEKLDAVAWYERNSGNSTHLVGKKAPNGLGLYDMMGNVWEWCQDWYGSYPRSTEANPLDNPQGPDRGSYRVNRGGSWGFAAESCRTTYRYWGAPGVGNNSQGARLIRKP